MRLKICGLTRRDDVERALETGAFALGFVVAPDSPRGLDEATVLELAAEAKAGRSAETWLVARGVDGTLLDRLMRRGAFDRLQLHGFDDAVMRDLVALGHRVVPSVDLHRSSPARVEALRRSFPLVHVDAGRGGEGRRLDPPVALLTDVDGLIFAGGLGPGDLPGLAARGIDAVDLGSALERVPGQKCAAALDRVAVFLSEEKRGETHDSIC